MKDIKLDYIERGRLDREEMSLVMGGLAGETCPRYECKCTKEKCSDDTDERPRYKCEPYICCTDTSEQWNLSQCKKYYMGLTGSIGIASNVVSSFSTVSKILSI
ncbi:MAG: hypothetical protein LBR51_00035 [Bacteroidales bacterium]|jgi:hypothetical protein|nr:hypothetical protein [Bacteroidales bacterium]